MLTAGVLAADAVRTREPVPPKAAVAVASPSAAATPAPVVVPARPSPAPTRTPQVALARRVTTRSGFGAYAQVGPVTLHYPVDVVELVGLHESGHDGAQPQDPLETGVRTGALASRTRETNPYGAADIVVHPHGQVRSPVTGTVVRAGSYTLYCDHTDDYLVIEPDARPGWEVKLLHFEGLSVRKGDRVHAGVTPVGRTARLLPFASQVDDHTVAPHWPHLHIEVVDPTVKDRPSGRTCD